MLVPAEEPRLAGRGLLAAHPLSLSATRVRHACSASSSMLTTITPRACALGAVLSVWALHAAAAAPAPAAAGNPSFVHGGVLVRFEAGGGERSVELPAGVPVGQAVAALEDNPAVEYAAPNHIARISSSATGRFVPNDKGIGGGWQQVQWNFLPCGSLCGQPPAAPGLESAGGINAPGAW